MGWRWALPLLSEVRSPTKIRKENALLGYSGNPRSCSGERGNRGHSSDTLRSGPPARPASLAHLPPVSSRHGGGGGGGEHPAPPHGQCIFCTISS